MAIVPRQTEADEEVVDFWKKKRQLSRDEVAALAAGINPFAWECRYAPIFPSDGGKETRTLDPDKVQQITDILTVFEHRLTGHPLLLDHMSLTKWRLEFLACGLSFPEYLSPDKHKNFEKFAARLGNIDSLKRILEAEGVPVLLHHWFLHDTWAAADAMLLLAGLAPDGTVIEQAENIYDQTFDAIEVARTLDGFETFPRSVLHVGDDEFVELNRFQGAWKHLRAVWASGNHPDPNPPRYYLDWAKSKNFVVPWLEWATQQGLITEGEPDAQPEIPLKIRAHVSDKLTKMNQAATKFWANADREDRGTHPENAKVAAWLGQQGFSETLADKAATIIRPEWAPTGRKPEE